RRQNDTERTPLSDRASDLQPAAHGIHEALADGQPQPDPLVSVALGVAQLKELVEDVVHVLGRDAGARVRHVDAHSAPAGAAGGHAHTALVSKFDRIADQVAEYPAQLDPVGA